MSQQHGVRKDKGTTRSNWKPLYRAGAIAPLITLTIYLIEVISVILVGDDYPTRSLEWFSLFEENKLLALLALNAFDVFSISLFGIMFLALYIALRQQDESMMLIATFFALLGITVFVASRADMGSTMLKLSDEYAAATTNMQRDGLVAVEQALGAPIRGTVDTMGYFFVAIASLIISIVIQRRDIFLKATAYTGVIGFLITIISRISLIFDSSFSTTLLPIHGLIWFMWWILISRGLFQLARES